MAIHESGEDYLEAILMIKKRNGNVRSIDIAHELSFSKPSVSVAMKNLKASNYITIDENGFINLTETGQEIADKIYERHTFLTGWLTSIGVDPRLQPRMPVRWSMRSAQRVFLPLRSLLQARMKIIAILVNNAFKTVQQRAKDKEDICRRADARQRYLTQDFTL